jgi:hypothetical protein
VEAGGRGFDEDFQNMQSEQAKVGTLEGHSMRGVICRAHRTPACMARNAEESGQIGRPTSLENCRSRPSIETNQAGVSLAMERCMRLQSQARLRYRTSTFLCTLPPTPGSQQDDEATVRSTFGRLGTRLGPFGVSRRSPRKSRHTPRRLTRKLLKVAAQGPAFPRPAFSPVFRAHITGWHV